MSRFYASVPNGWGVSDTSALDALKNARRAVGWSANDIRQAEQYVLEFPDGTEFETNPVWGSWRSTRAPVAIALVRNLPPERLSDLGRLLASKEEAI